MKTEDLIAGLASQPPAAPLNAARMSGQIISALVLVCGVFLLTLGVRPDLGSALVQPLIAVKTLLPALLFILALSMALRLAQPEASVRLTGFLAPVTVAALLFVIGTMTRPEAQWFTDVSPASVAECFGFITLLSALPLWISLKVLARGASTSPRLSGALAGLASGAGAATGYSFFCTQDNPIFYVIWYGAAITTATVVGTLVGAKVLRW